MAQKRMCIAPDIPATREAGVSGFRARSCARPITGSDERQEARFQGRGGCPPVTGPAGQRAAGRQWAISGRCAPFSRQRNTLTLVAGYRHDREGVRHEAGKSCNWPGLRRPHPAFAHRAGPGRSVKSHHDDDRSIRCGRRLLLL